MSNTFICIRITPTIDTSKPQQSYTFSFEQTSQIAPSDCVLYISLSPDTNLSAQQVKDAQQTMRKFVSVMSQNYTISINGLMTVSSLPELFLRYLNELGLAAQPNTLFFQQPGVGTTSQNYAGEGNSITSAVTQLLQPLKDLLLGGKVLSESELYNNFIYEP